MTQFLDFGEFWRSLDLLRCSESHTLLTIVVPIFLKPDAGEIVLEDDPRVKDDEENDRNEDTDKVSIPETPDFFVQFVADLEICRVHDVPPKTLAIWSEYYSVFEVNRTFAENRE